MSPIRVILATMPPMLAETIRKTLARDPDVEVISEVGTLDELEAAIERAETHVAVLGVAPGDWVASSGVLRDLLSRHPRLVIIALARDGRSGYVYQHQPRGVVIDDISPRSLVQLIRSNATVGVHPPVHPFPPN